MACPPLLSTPMRHFLEVAQAGSVHRAATRLFVAPSAVSRQIAKLEDGLGTPLFERQSRGMVLTAAGQRLAGHLRHVVLDAEQVLDQVRHLGRQSAARVRVCCTEGFASGFMPAFMQAFMADTPGSQIELLVGSPDEVAGWVLRGDADIGLKYAVAPEPGLRVAHAAQAPVMAVMAPDHPLAGRSVVTLPEVVGYPLLVGSQGMTARQLFDLACSARGLRYTPVFVSNFSSVMLPLLRSPQVLLSGLLTVHHLLSAGQAVVRPFDEPVLTQRRLLVLALEGRTLSGPVAACIERMIDFVGRHSGEPAAPASAAGPLRAGPDAVTPQG